MRLDSIECDLFGSLIHLLVNAFFHILLLFFFFFNSILFRELFLHCIHTYVNYTWSFAAYAYQNCFFYSTARSAVSLNIPRIITWKADYSLSQDASSDTRRCETAPYNCSNWYVNSDNAFDIWWWAIFIHFLLSSLCLFLYGKLKIVRERWGWGK